MPDFKPDLGPESSPAQLANRIEEIVESVVREIIIPRLEALVTGPMIRQAILDCIATLHPGMVQNEIRKAARELVFSKYQVVVSFQEVNNDVPGNGPQGTQEEPA